MVIARPAEDSSRVLFCHPERSFPIGSMLSCTPAEVAVFFRDGQTIGTLGPGHHSLAPMTVPFLGMVVSPGSSELDVEVIFVTTGPLSGIRVASKIATIDPQSQNMADVHFSGDAGVRITDPTRFVAQCGQPATVADADLKSMISRQLERATKAAIETVLTNVGSVLAMVDDPAHLQRVHAEAAARAEDLAELGVKLEEYRPLLSISADDRQAIGADLGALASAKASSEAMERVPTAGELRAGQKVKAQWSDGRYYSAVLTEHQGGYYKVTWDDGSEPSWVQIHQLRVREPAAGPAAPTQVPTPQYAPGTPVLCMWTDGRVYPATIRQWHNGYYEIVWQGNTNTQWVMPHQLRPA